MGRGVLQKRWLNPERTRFSSPRAVLMAAQYLLRAQAGWQSAEVEADRGMQGVIIPNRLKGMFATSELSKKGRKEVRRVWRRFHSGLQDSVLEEICCLDNGIDATRWIQEETVFFPLTFLLYRLFISPRPFSLHTSGPHALSQIKGDPMSSTVSLQDLI